MKRPEFLLPQSALVLLSSGINITEYESRIIETGFLYGIVFSVVIFYILILFLGLESKYPLYFSGLLLLAVLCSDISSDNLLRLLPVSNNITTGVIIYSSKAWILFLLTAYLHEIYRSVYSLFILWAVLVVTLLQQIFILFGIAIILPGGGAYIIFSLIYGIELLACFFVVFHALIISKRRDALVDIFGIMIASASYYSPLIMHIPNYRYLISAAVFLYLSLQILTAAIKIKKFYNEKTNAQLRFLHAQIKPHYIFNALNTIISISRYAPESALELLRDFGVYLQNSFNPKTENQFATLKDELEIVNVYLNIEKARFEERIEVEMELPERTDYLVPVCMLQPIVENAIVHGILGRPEGGKIFIGIDQDDKKLVFTVRDNGVGMSEERIFEVLESDDIGHIGLSNIHKRLKTLYKSGLTINSKLGAGTEVTWEIPLNA